IEPSAFVRLAADRIATENTHGTGCTLSSAIAAGLAKGLGLTEAVGAAKIYVTEALAAANRIKIGSGPRPTHPLHASSGRTALVPPLSWGPPGITARPLPALQAGRTYGASRQRAVGGRL